MKADGHGVPPHQKRATLSHWRLQSLEIKVGELTFDTVTREGRIDSTRSPITAAELSILEVLLQRSPAVAFRRTIALGVWDDEADTPGSTTLDVHLAGLRAKIAISEAKIEAVRAIGYRIVAP